MQAEAAVLACDHRERQVGRDVLERHPFAAECITLELLHHHHGCERRVDETESDNGKEKKGG
jgi:hypothetical protein